MTGKEAAAVGEFLQGLDMLSLQTGVYLGAAGFIDVVTDEKGHNTVGELKYHYDAGNFSGGIYGMEPLR